MYENYRSYIIWKQPFANVLHLRVLKNFAKFTRKHMCRNVLIRLLDVGQQLYQKETPAQLSSREFCETFKNTFFTDHLWTTASVLYYNALYISNISYLYSVNISPRYKKDSQSRSRSRESFFLWSFRRAVKIAIAFFDLFNSKQLLMLRS